MRLRQLREQLGALDGIDHDAVVVLAPNSGSSREDEHGHTPLAFIAAGRYEPDLSGRDQSGAMYETWESTQTGHSLPAVFLYPSA